MNRFGKLFSCRREIENEERSTGKLKKKMAVNMGWKLIDGSLVFFSLISNKIFIERTEQKMVFLIFLTK